MNMATLIRQAATEPGKEPTMTASDIKTVARRVLEEVFPANDEAALASLISD